MRILQIITKNTSTLDFTLPVFWQLREQDASVEISVLFCVFDKKEILRKSHFYLDIMSQYDVKLYDYSSFLKSKLYVLPAMITKMMSNSAADKAQLGLIKEKIVAPNKIAFTLRFIKETYNIYGLRGFAEAFYSLIHKMRKSMTSRWVDFNKVLPSINPDFVLFDCRDTSKFIGRTEIYDYLYKTKKPVALVPHAPHLRDPISEFAPFDEYGESLPEFCQFWVPLKFGEPWKAVHGKEKQFHITGYPGLDSGWLNLLGERNKTKKNQQLKILYVIRRYLPEHQERTKDLDYYIIDYEEFIKPLYAVKESLTDYDYEVIIKPHPANNYRELKRDLEKTNVKKYSISYDSVYAHIGEVDLVLSLPSTVLLVTAMAGIPTVLLNSELQQQIHKRWQVLENMYGEMNYFLENVEDLPNTINSLIINKDKNLLPSNDIVHLRQFYEDSATEKVLSNIRSSSI